MHSMSLPGEDAEHPQATAQKSIPGDTSVSYEQETEDAFPKGFTVIDSTIDV